MASDRGGGVASIDPFASIFSSVFEGTRCFRRVATRNTISIHGGSKGAGQGGMCTYTFSNTTSSSGRGGSRTISKMTTVVSNGRKTTRTETTIVHPDGT